MIKHYVDTDEADDIEAFDYRTSVEYAEYLAEQKDSDFTTRERVMNTVVGKWAPADFLYDPLSKEGYE